MGPQSGTDLPSNIHSTPLRDVLHAPLSTLCHLVPTALCSAEVVDRAYTQRLQHPLAGTRAFLRPLGMLVVPGLCFLVTRLIVSIGDEARDGSTGNPYETETLVTVSGLSGAIVPWLCTLCISW